MSAANAEAACSALAADASAAPALRADALLHAARARLSAQDYPRAIELGNQALALQPTAATHSDVGTAYFEQGDYAASIGHFNAALQLDPHHPTARASLASANAHLANPGLRQQDIDQANRIALEAIGMQRISSLRPACDAEARALNVASVNGVKRAGFDAAKLERLLSRMMLRGADQLTQDAQRLRESAAGPMHVANLYMACLMAPHLNAAAGASPAPPSLQEPQLQRPPPSVVTASVPAVHPTPAANVDRAAAQRAISDIQTEVASAQNVLDNCRNYGGGAFCNEIDAALAVSLERQRQVLANPSSPPPPLSASQFQRRIAFARAQFEATSCFSLVSNTIDRACGAAAYARILSAPAQP